MPTNYDYTVNDCHHPKFDMDRTNFGICARCKEERQFSDDGKTWTVVRSGIPRKPVTRDNRVIHEYYVANREGIIRDLLDLGQPAMLKRWDISSGTWAPLKREWIYNGWLDLHATGSPEQLPLPGSPGSTAPGALSLKMWVVKTDGQVVVTIKLPPLPAWREDWPADVKGKWLDTYSYILKGRKEPVKA